MFIARGLACALVLIALLARVPAGGQADGLPPVPKNSSPGPGSFEVEWHETISICGDDDFTAENGIVDGTGTGTDPYIISGWDLNTSSSIGIHIVNTEACFIILDCYIHGNHSHPGILLENVTNGRIESCFISDNSVGIMSGSGGGEHGASLCNFTNNSIISNRYAGIEFNHEVDWHLRNVIISNNISENGCGISAIVFKENTITRNLISRNKSFAIAIYMCMGGGGDNLIHHNNFIGNNNGSKQGIDRSCMMGLRSLWNDSCQGNFWSDWTGPDDNGDGIVDEPYKFNYSTYDHFPLAEPVEAIEYRNGPPEIPAVPPDLVPPVIFDLQPVNMSVLDDDRPPIAAGLNDSSGLDLQNVSLLLDGVDITRNATLTCTSISYSPPEPLPAGEHTVELKAADGSGRRNLAHVLWKFTVRDLAPPRIFDLMPADLSRITDSSPVIGANFSDESGIYPPAVRLLVDKMDATGRASYSTRRIEYRPPEPLADGAHTVRLTLADGSPSHNPVSMEWSFTIERSPMPPEDRCPPLVQGIRPGDSSRTTEPRPPIAANYSDGSGIDVANITLLLDGKDVTRQSTIMDGGIIYHPPEPLVEGEHFVSLRVGDLSKARNIAFYKWSFTILVPEPNTPPFADNPEIDTSAKSVSTVLGFAIGVALAIIVAINYRRKQ